MEDDMRHSLESCWKCDRDDLEVGEVRRTGDGWWVCEACAIKHGFVRDGDEVRLKNGREGVVDEVNGKRVVVFLPPLAGGIVGQVVDTVVSDVEVIR